MGGKSVQNDIAINNPIFLASYQINLNLLPRLLNTSAQTRQVAAETRHRSVELRAEIHEMLLEIRHTKDPVSLPPIIQNKLPNSCLQSDY